MLWGKFLHLYQPHGQDPDILEQVVEQCYRPLLEGILNHDKAKVTLNVNASLLELFDEHGYHDLIDMLKKSSKQNKVEFTGSAKYHALLPFLSEQEMQRQITANHEASRHYLGEAYKPRGIFLPEMAYSPKVAPVLENAGFEWVILDEIAYNGKTNAVDYNKLYKIKNTNLKAFFRERRTSNLIMGAVARSKEKLLDAMREEMENSRYLITGMDGETFGHHRTGFENLLFEIFEAPEFDLVYISDLLEKWSKDVEEVEPVASTWASNEKEISQGIQFITWNDPDNEIHKLQWELHDLVIDQFNQLPKDSPVYEQLRHQLDYAVASDQFYWASARPWWSIEMIEEGAHALLDIIQQQPDVDQKVRDKAQDYYRRILSLAFDWKRSGKIVQMRQNQREEVLIPFKERTLEAGGAEVGVYHAFVDMMLKQEKQAAKKQDYEEAILWRDAVYKLDNKLDIYEAVHAVDLLRTRLSNEHVEKIIENYKDKYRYIRGGQPEQR